MSLASMVAVITLACTQLSLVPDLKDPACLFALAISLLIIFRHRGNLWRLRAGTESRLASLERWSYLTPGLHALATGLWCGAAWFFSLGVAPSVFSIFKDFVSRPPVWCVFNEPTPELGSRLAGVAVGPLFSPYFMLQTICGIIATGTAIGFLVTRPGRMSKWRAILLLVAMTLVAIGWPVSQHVSELRLQRFDDQAAKDSFAAWHVISLVLNLGVLALLAPVMALAAYVRQQSPPVATGGH
jgi:acyl phosphate:glycerol-3-phosphate acyltransferase